ncbi:hypothetical protein OB2597_13023 [Pseudooceanicola batsensis HTCC2597]|uniref:Uncharacterized protein n=1 Tax=Pseudooceanicola batsensis (strain ATCC BAA-863 / DSM 15984 / KCTC 12145 / HTCC2597) TaxID=252305 RepID=A3TY33_PSEBH|nr:glycosyltransferase family 4 protein [Pseudooceanicola batsensis]EAQ03067.1 hypothetical protein OB2597_13023 [Pseudooceanicola batsensis HTCC2597]
MKILFSHRFFWPDTAPYGTFLRRIAAHCAAAGHEVSVVSSRPSYNMTETTAPARETLEGVDVARVWVFAREKRSILLRLANVVIYCARLFFRILRERPDVVTASTYPPVVAAMSAALAAKLVGARFVYHLQDIHPEVSRLSGSALGRFPVFGLLRWLDTLTLRMAARIVTLSDDMAETLRQRDARLAGKIRIINNLSLDEGRAPVPAPREDGRFRVIFAGNLGRYQDLPLVAAGIARLFDRHPELELFFLGNGALERELKESWGDHPQVRFHPFVPFDEARAMLAESDLGIVSIMPGLSAVAYPSKLLTYQSLGLPVLAIVDPDSHIARDLAATGAGVVVRDRSEDAVAAAVEEAIAAPQLRAKALAHAARHDGRAVLDAWTALMDEFA